MKPGIQREGEFVLLISQWWNTYVSPEHWPSCSRPCPWAFAVHTHITDSLFHILTPVSIHTHIHPLPQMLPLQLVWDTGPRIPFVPMGSTCDALSSASTISVNLIALYCSQDTLSVTLTIIQWLKSVSTHTAISMPLVLISPFWSFISSYVLSALLVRWDAFPNFDSRW